MQRKAQVANKESKRRVLQIGDRVCCNGFIVTIAEIYRQDWFECYGFDAEFVSTDGVYRSWKQGLDGGFLVE